MTLIRVRRPKVSIIALEKSLGTTMTAHLINYQCNHVATPCAYSTSHVPILQPNHRPLRTPSFTLFSKNPYVETRPCLIATPSHRRAIIYQYISYLNICTPSFTALFQPQPPPLLSLSFIILQVIFRFSRYPISDLKGCQELNSQW